jgi:hypothetical protein
MSTEMSEYKSRSQPNMDISNQIQLEQTVD